MDPLFFHNTEDIFGHLSCLAWFRGGQQEAGALSKKLIHAQWEAPDIGCMKWNVDASINPPTNLTAMGGVLRNDAGVFVCIFSKPITCLDINKAEVWAISRALRISIMQGEILKQEMCIESDSFTAVKWCNDLYEGPWHLSFILNFIRNCLHEYKITVRYRGRESNGVADCKTRQF